MAAMPDFEAWAVFAKVAELRSFSGTAVELDMAAGTVSKIIGRLEAELGITLFQRSTRKLSLTASGQALAPRAAALLKEARLLESAAVDEGSSLVGTVRVAAPLTFGLSHIAPALPDFADRYPGITLDMQVDDGQADLVAGGYDLALRIGCLPPDAPPKVRKLADNRTMLVASPGCLQRHGTPDGPDDLSRFPCLGFTSAPPADTWTLAHRNGAIRRVRHRGPLRTNNGALMMPMLLAGQGIAFVPEFFIAAELASGRLTRVLPDWSMPPTALYLLAPSSGPQSPRVAAVIAFFTERFGTGGAIGDAADA